MKVVATAGHVDHGKSTLVRALTGMEPDRWAEERRRGLTIDLGYAWTTLDSGETVAFVDVPGHERFIGNMLAGLGPVPAVLFAVAADGGWMPQSQEHLAAADALGVTRGLLVVTRADLADPGPATREALARIAETSLGQVESVAVSAVRGEGMDEARAALTRLARALPDPPPEEPVRLWIDRSFTIRGSGTVVTGTLPAGTIRAGDELELAPRGQRVRVRGIEALGEPAEAVTGVARVALNLRGVPPGVPRRGMALVTPGGWTLSREADVRIRPGPSGLPTKFPPALHLHIGSACVPAKLRLLDQPALRGPAALSAPSAPSIPSDPTASSAPSAPGGPAAPSTLFAPGGLGKRRAEAVHARLTLREPLPLHAGDRILLRDPGAAGLAVYGATVLDPFPAPFGHRGGGQRGTGRRGAAAAAARELASWPDSPKAADLLRRHGLLRAPSLLAAGITDLPAPVAGEWLADEEHWENLRRRLPAVVAAFLAKNPLAKGMPLDAARAALSLPSRDLITALLPAPPTSPVSPVPPASLNLPASSASSVSSAHPASPTPPASLPSPVSPAISSSGHSGNIVNDGGYLRPAAGTLPPKVARAVAALREDLAADPFAAPDAERLRELRLDARALAAAARAGLLLRISDQVVLAPGADTEAARRLADLPQPFTTSQARQALRTTRRVAIPLLEHLDRTHLTARLPDDTRRLFLE